MFLNLIMLSGLAGVSVPVILHMLSRTRYKTVDWGAMMFLLGTDRKQRRNSRIRQWLLLGMRMLLIALVAVALARPLLSKSLSIGGGQMATVLIVDRSASMSIRENDQVRMDAAKTAAIQILSRLRRGDELTLLTAGDSSAEARPTTDLQGLARTIADLQPARGYADMAAAMAKAADVLEHSTSVNREIYIVCDRQKASWNGIDAAWSSAWKKRLAQQTARPRIFLVPVGGQETANVAVEAFELTNPPLVINQPAEIEARVRNFGSSPVSDVSLQIREGERSVLSTTLTLASGASMVVRTQTSFDKTGPHVLTAGINSAGFILDDTRDLALAVGDPIPTLIISGDERGGLFRRESDFLRLALAPYATSGRKGTDPATVEVLTTDHWPRLDATRNPVVVLANAAQVTESQAGELEQYVYSGGGLIVTMGNLVQARSYNSLLYKNGSGILPAELGDSSSAEATSPTSILGVDLNHPMLRFLRDRPDPVPVVNINRRFPTRQARPDSHTLITLANGQPLLLEARAGRGRVLMLTSTINADWNSVPLTGFYLPLVQSAVKYMATGNLPELNIPCGTAIAFTVTDLASATPPAITLPDGRVDHMEVQATPVATELHYGWTAMPGRYTVDARIGKEDRKWVFVAQPPTAESDLSPLDDGGMAELGEQVDLEVLDATRGDFAQTVGEGRQGHELWLPLLLAAIAVGIGEMVLTRSWAQGERAPQ
jgi:hypothetical protein